MKRRRPERSPPYNPFNQPFVVTAELANPKGLLKRDMYIDAAIEVDLGSRLAIPADAVIHTGTHGRLYPHIAGYL